MDNHLCTHDIENQDTTSKFAPVRWMKERKKNKQKNKLIKIINKIPRDRPLHTKDLNEYLHFINSSNLPNGDYGIIKKSVDNYSDLVDLNHKRSIYAEFDIEEFPDKYNGTITIEESSNIEINMKANIESTYLARHWNLDKLEKEFPANADVRDKLASRALIRINEALINDMCNFLINDIIKKGD